MENSVASGHNEIMQPNFSSNTDFMPMVFYNDLSNRVGYISGFNGSETGPLQYLIAFDNSYLGIGIDYENGNVQMWHNGTLFCTYSYTYIIEKMELDTFQINFVTQLNVTVNIGKQPFAYSAPSGYKSIYDYLLDDNRLVDTPPNIFRLK